MGPGEKPRAEDRDRFGTVLAEFERRPEDKQVVINNECIIVASLATLLSLAVRFGLRYRLLLEDTSGLQQVQGLNVDDHADFVITNDAPWYLAGKDKAENYRIVLPINEEEQFVLEMQENEFTGRLPAPNPLVLTYNDSSALEHIIVETGRKDYYHRNQVHLIESLVELVERSIIDVHRGCTLRPGDQVIAWDPLANGILLQNPSLLRLPRVHKNLISLLCRIDWLEGRLASVTQAFKDLFVFEFNYLSKNREWARHVLLNDHPDVGYDYAMFKERFSIGSGLPTINT